MAQKEPSKLKMAYDAKADVLYASKGAPRPCISEETEEGILLRRDKNTREVVGFTIINYSRKKARGELKTIPYFPSVILPE